MQEFAELDAMSKAEVGTMKAFMSRATDRMRDPYGAVVKDVPRRCVFFGTVNEGGYLKDPTGARRFWPLAVDEPIDLGPIGADRDQLWAEASQLETAGEPDVLPQELWATAAERQADQTSEDPWTDILRHFLQRRALRSTEPLDGEPRLPADKVHTDDLLQALRMEPCRSNRISTQRIRTIMESELGWSHMRGVRIGDRVAAGYVRR